KWFTEWNKTNINKHTVCWKVIIFICLFIMQGYAANFSVRSINFLRYSIPDKLHFFVVKCSFLYNFLCAEFITSVYNGNFISKLRKLNTFFHGRIAPADNNNIFLLKECTITNRTI